MRTLIAFLALAACSTAEPTSATTTDSTSEPTDSPTETDTPPTDTPPTETDTTETDTEDSDTDGSTAGHTGTVTHSASTTPTADTGPAAPACDTVNSGTDWAWRGACPGMRTPCEIVVTGCQMAITYPGGMSMGMPTGGLVTGSDIRFNNNGVAGCVGTVLDPDSIQGTCQNGGCAFTLER